jgi:hypothetical protein
VSPQRLYESPYRGFDPSGVDGVVSDAEAEKIVHILKRVEANASGTPEAA